MVVVLLVERLEMLTQLHVHPPFLPHPCLLEMLAHRRRALALRPQRGGDHGGEGAPPGLPGRHGGPEDPRQAGVHQGLVQTQLKQPPLLAATPPAVAVAGWNVHGGPGWPLPAAPLEAALPEAVRAGASLQAGWCPI